MMKHVMMKMTYVWCVLTSALLSFGENLVRNGDFTSGLTYWEHSSEPAPGPRFSLDQGNLMWQSQKNSGYVVAWQKIEGMKTGRFYELSGNVKCEKLTGAKESGATLCLEFSGRNFRDGFRYGAHPGGIRNTQDWTRISSVIGPVPGNADVASVGLYVRKNSVRKQFFTGKAWWKDIELKQIPMLCQILDPSYKMNVTDKLTLKFRLWPEDWHQKCNDWQISVKVHPKKWGKVVGHPVFSASLVPERPEFIWSSAVALVPGTYQLTVELRDMSGKELWSHGYEIYRKDLSGAVVKIDENCRLSVAGRPFFLLGIYNNSYTSGHFEQAFKFINESGLNTLVSYREMTQDQLDRYHDAGKKVILSVKDYYHRIWYCPGSISSPYNEIYPLAKFVKKYMHHPALLAWYVNDELGPEVLDSHERHYEVINRLDDHHPAWNLHNTVSHIPLLGNHCDIMGIDEYPLVRRGSKYLDFQKEMRAVYDEMGAGVRMLKHKRPLIAVLQCYDVYEKQPSIEDIRNMSYQALAAGAMGIVYYSLENDFTVRNPGHWRQFCGFTREFAAKEQIFLSAEPVSAVRVTGREIVSFQRAYQKRNYVFIISLSKEYRSVNVELPSGVTIVQVEKNGRKSTGKTESGGYASELSPYEVQMLVFE